MDIQNLQSNESVLVDNNKLDILSYLNKLREIKNRKIIEIKNLSKDQKHIYERELNNIIKLELQEKINLYQKTRLRARKEYFNEQKNTQDLLNECEFALRSFDISSESRNKLSERVKSTNLEFYKYRSSSVRFQRECTRILNLLKKELYSF